ncbi:SigB/SigF/SigG family RNA polymerase sigma factor [Kitasatospora sp. NPDC051705]|uniref:SigB/SigF/SigG family RNA polymerase sigma factor n=1 Tax=Kitasatospora sp. NPDC051705 TaxID=3364057 RepID=UPI0037892077
MTMTSSELLPCASRPAPSSPGAPVVTRGPDPDLASLLADVGDPCDVAPADARELTRTLLARLAALDEGTMEYSYVRGTLIELNMSLVQFVLRRFAPHHESRDDLLQVGAIGLIKAIDRFDPDHGVEFSSFAIPTVMGEIRRHFRDNTWAVHVPRRLQELRLALAKAQDALSQQLDREPTVAELARHLELPEESITEGLAAARARSAGSLDLPAGPQQDGAARSADRLLGPDADHAELVTDLVALKPLIAALPPRERLILSMRFTEDLTQSQIGGRLGLSQMHVSRLLSRTLRTLREGLVGDGEPSVRAGKRDGQEQGVTRRGGGDE